MKVTEDPGDVRADPGDLRGLVPTMGFLHEGHLSLVEAARRTCDTVVVSIFVNPLQFDQKSDLDRYPRDLDRDLALADAAGVDVVFAPPPERMFPDEPLTSVSVATVTDHMEGRHRPGHFRGVATVVAKLLAALQPGRAYFGRKDHQQLAVIRKMTADLSYPTEIIGCPIVREPDGIALSSRNVFIEDRAAATSISRSLMAVADAIEGGAADAAELEAMVAAGLELDSVDYVTLASQSQASPLATLDQPAFLAVAGRLGAVRLIDNLPIDLVGGEWRPNRGMLLERPSVLRRA